MANHSAETLTALAGLIASGGIEVVDLTQPLEPKTPVLALPAQFAQSPPFEIEVLSEYDERGPAWYWNKIKLGEHTGTHFDAPIHWISGKDFPNNATDTIPVEQFIGPACVIDAVEQARADPDFLVTPEFIQAWEGAHGSIPNNAWVLFRTGWSGRLGSDGFLNVGDDGAHTPGWRRDALEFLANERDVRGVGGGTVGTDAVQAFLSDPPFPCHATMHGSNRFGLASLVNLDRLPPTDAIVIAPPLKIVRGSGSPVRVLALVPKG
jgi:kynurenine formamidase